MSKGIITMIQENVEDEKKENTLVLYFKMSDQDKLNSDMREYMLKNGFTVTGFYSICEAWNDEMDQRASGHVCQQYQEVVKINRIHGKKAGSDCQADIHQYLPR